MALASVAVLSSVDVQQGFSRDHSSKEAIAAADAGASVALLRLNRFQSKLSAATPCVGPAGETLLSSAGWCPATTAESVGGATYTYRVSAYAGTGIYSVVAVGTEGGVSRRVDVGLLSYNGKNIFAEEKMIGQEGIKLKGGVTIKSDVGTNGNIELNSENGKAPILCGSLRHGLGKTAPTPKCNGTVGEGEKNLPEITPPSNLSTSNSNCRLSATCTEKSKVDPFVTIKGKKEEVEKRTEKEPWESSTKTITISNNSRLTMGGGDYFICKLVVKGELIMAAGSEIRIFVDTPGNCKLKAGEPQVEVVAGGSIVSTGYNAQNGYKIPGIYLLGESTAKLSGNSTTDEVMIYGPKSEIEIEGDATWKGLMAAKKMNLHGNATFESDPNIKAPNITFASLLGRTRYVECVGATATPPDANC
ncbi:MAG: hypothetical protein ACJ75S_10220 [Solirubrobacterales bacterium]